MQLILFWSATFGAARMSVNFFKDFSWKKKIPNATVVSFPFGRKPFICVLCTAFYIGWTLSYFFYQAPHIYHIFMGFGAAAFSYGMNRLITGEM